MSQAPNQGPDRGIAVALSHDHPDAAPRVVAKGYGMSAEAIIARAREAGVYVHGSPALVNLLMQVNLDSQIPPQLYVAVAEMLAWVHRLEEEAGGTALASPAAARP